MISTNNNSTNQNQSFNKKPGSGNNGTIDVLAAFRQQVGSGLDKDIHTSLIESFGTRNNIKPRIIEGSSISIEIDSLVFERIEGDEVLTAVFLIDSPDTDLGNTNEKINGRDTCNPILMGDIVQTENFYMDVLTKNLQAHHKDKSIVFTMCAVIPRLTLKRINAEGKLPKDIVKNLWVNIETSIVSYNNDLELPISKVAETNRFTFRPEFNTDETCTSTGLPVFREWEVSLRTQSDNKNISKAQVNTSQVVSLIGHTDKVYCGQAERTVEGNIPRLRTWEYNLHITQAKSEVGYSNLATTLLALGSVATMFNGNTRYVPLKRNLTSKRRNLMTLNRDLIKEHQFDITDKDFTLKLWTDIYTFPDTKVILHVPECTEETTWLQMLELASHNPDVRRTVIETARQICASYDDQGNLTGSFFDQYWDDSQPIGMLDSDDVILNGYFLDENDVERDIVGWNYDAARNDIENNPLFLEYDNTFRATDIPLPIRLSERVRILREQFPNVVFTGRSRPFRLNPAFIIALWNGMTAAMGGKYKIENTHDLEDTSSRAGYVHRSADGFSSNSFNMSPSGLNSGGMRTNMRSFRTI